MHAKGLKRMIKKSEDSFVVKYSIERKSVASTSVKEVAIALQEKTSSDVQTCKARGNAHSLGMPVSTVHKILRNIQHCSIRSGFNSCSIDTKETFCSRFFCSHDNNE